MSAIGTVDEVADRFAAALGLTADQVSGEDVAGTAGVVVPPERWLDALGFARDGESLDFFDWLSAVDETDAEPPGFDVVAHLVSTGSRPGPPPRLLIRTRVPEGTALASVTGLWPGAAWHERETYEMFGISFEGFDDGTGLGLRPLLLPEGFEGTPLRKSFVLGCAGQQAVARGQGAGRERRPPWLARPAQAPPARRTAHDLGAAARRRHRWRTAMAEALDALGRVVAVLAAFLVLPLLVGQTEHKVMAHMQGRLGPMYAGGFHGWAQLVADGVKFVQKEDVTPAAADPKVFRLAPLIALVPYLVALTAIPIGPGWVAADLDSGLLFVLAASAVGVLGTLMAGWSSANKYALLGGLRTAAQLLSYELPVVLAASSVAIAAGTLNLSAIIVQWQWWWIPLAGPGPRLLPRGGRGRAAAAALRHAGRRLRDRLRAVHRVHRAAVRLLPALRVRRHRAGFGADRRALPRRLARAVAARAGLAVDAGQDGRCRGGHHLGPDRLAPAARGPAAAAVLAGACAPGPGPAGGHVVRGGGRHDGGDPVSAAGDGLPGLIKGLAVTARTMTRPAHTR